LQISSSGSLTSIEDGAFSGGQLEQTLVALQMPGNGFESIPPEIFELRNLQSLDLSENTIGVVDGKMLRSFAALEELNLGHNLLADLNGVVLPKSLRILNVQNNQVLKSPKLINR
jgi:Leucine-rich repeat (LRR) protein